MELQSTLSIPGWSSVLITGLLTAMFKILLSNTINQKALQDRLGAPETMTRGLHIRGSQRHSEEKKYT